MVGGGDTGAPADKGGDTGVTAGAAGAGEAGGADPTGLDAGEVP